MTDLGSVHERAASLFTVQLSQFASAAVPGEEDRVLVCVSCVCVCVLVGGLRNLLAGRCFC